MLGTLLVGLAGLAVLFLVVAATRPAAYRVERRRDFAASPGRVFAVLSDLRRLSRALVLFGKPLEQTGADLQKTFTGPATGVGQALAWRGKEAGEGTLTLEQAVAEREVVLRLEYVKPMASTVRWTLTVSATAEGCAVTSCMAGDHNFLGKALSVVMNFDRVLGKDLEQGLGELQAAVNEARR